MADDKKKVADNAKKVADNAKKTNADTQRIEALEKMVAKQGADIVSLNKKVEILAKAAPSTKNAAVVIGDDKPKVPHKPGMHFEGKFRTFKDIQKDEDLMAIAKEKGIFIPSA